MAVAAIRFDSGAVCPTIGVAQMRQKKEKITVLIIANHDPPKFKPEPRFDGLTLGLKTNLSEPSLGNFPLDIPCERNGVTFIESILSTWQAKMIKMTMISVTATGS